MPEIDKVEEPVVSSTHTFWFKPSEGEDWGSMVDSTWPGRPFHPNRLCVLVSESSGQVHSFWSQVREEHSGEDWTRCNGTRAAENRHEIPDGSGWWWDALFAAEKVVREQVRTRSEP